MTRVLTAALAFALLLAPGARVVAAADEVTPVPASSGVECPPVEYVDGVPVIDLKVLGRVNRPVWAKHNALSLSVGRNKVDKRCSHG